MKKGYTFENPEQTTFKALKFNDQYFTRGRGLFIHIMKYFPSIAKEAQINSTSALEWTPENFAEATHRVHTHFKGIKFEYVDLPKGHREEIRALSKVGEGWWPERKRLKEPGVDFEVTLHSFMINYENPPHYVRRLGRGFNVTLEERMEMQSGVDFNRKGFGLMRKEFMRLVGAKELTFLRYPKMDAYYYHMRQLTMIHDGLLKMEKPEWRVWLLYGDERRERYLKNVKD